MIFLYSISHRLSSAHLPCAYKSVHFALPFLRCLRLSISFVLLKQMGSSFSDGIGDDEELHVLAVDDSVVERKLLEGLLKSSAYKVTTAENGLTALEYLGLSGENRESTMRANDLKINLIITDYCMPGMTGYELMKKVKESSSLKEIPVVIMSSENIPTRIEKCLEDGAHEFMLKPLQQSDVKRLRCHMTKFHKPPHCGWLCLGR